MRWEQVTCWGLHEVGGTTEGQTLGEELLLQPPVGPVLLRLPVDLHVGVTGLDFIEHFSTQLTGEEAGQWGQRNRLLHCKPSAHWLTDGRHMLLLLQCSISALLLLLLLLLVQELFAQIVKLNTLAHCLSPHHFLYE